MDEENFVDDNDNPIMGDQRTDELLEELSNQQCPDLGPYLGGSDKLPTIAYNTLQFHKCFQS